MEVRWIAKNEQEILRPVAMKGKIPAGNAKFLLNKSPNLIRGERRARTNYQHDQGSGSEGILRLL